MAENLDGVAHAICFPVEDAVLGARPGLIFEPTAGYSKNINAVIDDLVNLFPIGMASKLDGKCVASVEQIPTTPNGKKKDLDQLSKPHSLSCLKVKKFLPV